MTRLFEAKRPKISPIFIHLSFVMLNHKLFLFAAFATDFRIQIPHDQDDVPF
jgi:hypothetical protein